MSAMRPDQQGPARPQGEPLQPQDQAAVPAELCSVTLISDAALERSVAAHFRQCVEIGGSPWRPDAFLMKAKDDELSQRARELKREIEKKRAAAAA